MIIGLLCWGRLEEPVTQNRYVYVRNQPLQNIDPSGLTDIFIGGANDDDYRLVSTYVDSFKISTNGERTVEYFEWHQQSDIINYINNATPPINIVGHSYGATTATNVAELLGAQDSPVTVDLLVTIDPVSRFWSKPGDLSGNVTNWINVNATPTKRDWSDTVASLGGKWGEWSDGRADTYYTLPENH